MKKMLFVVALLAMLVPATYARDYLHQNPDGTTSFTGSPGDASGQNPATNPDWEFDGATSERKAESYNWPAEYKFVDVCVIPVKMEVGYWIKVNGCKDKVLILKQTEIHKYAGQVTVNIETNVNLEIKASWSKASGMPTINQDVLTVNGVGTATLNAPGGDIVIFLKVKDVDLKGFNVDTQVGKCIQIGTVTIQVRPKVTPTLAGAC